MKRPVAFANVASAALETDGIAIKPARTSTTGQRFLPAGNRIKGSHHAAEGRSASLKHAEGAIVVREEMSRDIRSSGEDGLGVRLAARRSGMTVDWAVILIFILLCSPTGVRRIA